MTMSASRPAQPAGESPAVRQLQIDVWGDLACPWCYVGKNRLDRAIVSSPHAGAITVMVRSFELDPTMSHDVKPNLEMLGAKYGVSLAQARAIEDKAVALAQREGLPFAVDRVVANSFDVHSTRFDPNSNRSRISPSQNSQQRTARFRPCLSLA